MEDLYIHRGRGFGVRLARPEDNAGLCELMRKVHLRGTLDLRQERDPDFFALLEMHLGQHEVWVAEGERGHLGGSGSVAVRPGWLDGAVRTVGYLSDLRSVPGFRGVRALPLAYARVLARFREVHGAEAFYTVIFDSNQLAKGALVGGDGGPRHQGLPRYRPMTPFQMTSVQFTLPKPKPSRPITRATDRDRDELVAFLARQAKRRIMGDVFDDGLLERRFARWPGFGLESFFIARDGQGRIAGTVAPWDTQSFKRTRVLGYHEGMRWVRLAFDLGARVGRFRKLPPPGDCFDFSFLSHLEVEGDDPAILRDLLLEAYRALRGSGQHFMSAMIPRGSPLEAAFRGFTVNRTGMTVYAVTLPDSRFSDFDFATQHPGFEMALS